DDALAFWRGAPSGFFRPLVSLSFGVNRWGCGLQPRCYGLSNLVLLLACAAAIFVLVRGLGLSKGNALLASSIVDIQLARHQYVGVVDQQQNRFAAGAVRGVGRRSIRARTVRSCRRSLPGGHVLEGRGDRHSHRPSCIARGIEPNVDRSYPTCPVRPRSRCGPAALPYFASTVRSHHVRQCSGSLRAEFYLLSIDGELAGILRSNVDIYGGHRALGRCDVPPFHHRLAET